MTKVDIISGFLGAGKTTLIKKLIKEAFAGEKLVLIENEFGDIGIDGGFMQDAGIEVTEMNSGCICCSLVGDFGDALQKVIAEYNPDRILIEPSGVGKLSDVIKAVMNIHSDKIKLNSFTTVADAKKCKMYMKNFGEFFNNQIENAATVILSHTDGISDEKMQNCLELLKEHNANAVYVTTDWNEIDGKKILSAMERTDTLDAEVKKLIEENVCPECGGHHEHDECCHHDEHHHEHGECCHHDEHHHEHNECCHHDEHHHEHGECCHHGEHHHEHGECCHHGEHHHEHGGHHHADEIFSSWGTETAKKYTKSEIEGFLSALSDTEKYGKVLRAKGIVPSNDKWIYFDYVPEEPDVREGEAQIIGRICVIGSEINEENLKNLFNV